MGKILISALLRSMFYGQILLFRNGPQPFFPVARLGLTETMVDPRKDFSSEEAVRTGSIHWRFEMAHRLAAAQPRSWAVLCDVDVVPLRNWDHLFEGRQEDILYFEDACGRPDPGFIAVRGDRIQKFATEWAAACPAPTEFEHERPDRVALQHLLQSKFWKGGVFERGEVVRAFDDGADLLLTVEAAAVHLAGCPLKTKSRMAFALYMMWVYGTDDGVFLDLLES